MIVNVENRVPANAGRVKMTPVDGQSYTYDLIRADNPSVTGTSVNRDLLMKMQGFEASTTTFNSDGSITEVGSTGTLKTVFNANGSITETFTATAGGSISKTTVFNSNGAITVTVG